MAEYGRKAAHARWMAEGAMPQAVKACLFDETVRNGRFAAKLDCAEKLRGPSREKPINRQTKKDQRPRWPRTVVMGTEKGWYYLVRRTSFQLLIVLAWVTLASNISKALTIIPSYDSSITAAPNAADIENSILSVVGAFDSLIADPINIKVFFTIKPTPENLLSQSKASLYAVPYDAYAAVLAGKAALTENPVLTTAVANLPVGNKGSLIVVTSPALRALGISNAAGLLGTDGERGHGDFDGVVTLNSGLAI